MCGVCECTQHLGADIVAWEGSRRIKNEIVSQISYVQKASRLLNNEEKKKELLSNLNKVFDIAKCKCFFGKAKEHYNYSNCTCPDGNKIINFEEPNVENWKELN